MENNLTIICLTPVRNESWILDRFLKATSLWADYIIISDQGSTDGSIEIAKKYPKVILLENKELPFFDEYLMRKPLFDEARKIEGKKILISLDADELFTPNFAGSIEWQTMLSAKPGTILCFPWLNIRPEFDSYWSPGRLVCGYMDDGAEYTSEGVIHASRSIEPKDHDTILLNEIGVLHFQYTDWERMSCKHRWYQCFELIKKVNSPVGIFRRYHHMYEVDASKFHPIPRSWIEGYARQSIDITSVYHQAMLPWEDTVLNYMDEYGVSCFGHLNIWDISWMEIARKWERPNPEKYKDPRSKWEKAVNRWLINTQKSKNKFWIRQIERLIALFY